MHGAKEGSREGYRERVREREGNRERDGEWEKEKYTQFGREASTDHPLGKGWVNAKIGWTFVTFNDLWGHNSLKEILV